MGLTSYANGTGFNQVEQYNVGSTPTADGLILLQNKLFEDFQAGASWLMQRATFGTIRTLKDSQNRYLFDLDQFIKDAVNFTLLGRPVNYAADMPAVGSNNLAIAYGDFKQGYYIVDRIGIRTLRDPFTSKPNVLFYTTKRVGGGMRNFQAVKIGKCA
jgi:HK97 family phage major capsid protein